MNEPQTTVLRVTGMSCQHCVASVTETLSSMPGVSNVEVSLEQGQATIAGTGLDRSALVSAVEDLGFDAE